MSILSVSHLHKNYNKLCKILLEIIKALLTCFKWIIKYWKFIPNKCNCTWNGKFMPFIQRIFGKCFHLHSPLLLSINKTCTFTQPVQEHELCKWKQRLSEKHFFVLKIIDKGKEEMKLYAPNISGSIWTEIEEKARIDDQKGDFSFLPFRRWRKDVHSKKFYRLLYWLYSREESRMGVVKADEWRFFLLRNGKEKSTEWKFLYFSSIIILLRHQHTCT